MNIAQETTLHSPMRIVGIQQCTPLDQAHATLNELWSQWQNHKASRLPSFTLTIYCVYQYFDDSPNDVQITLGRIVAQDLPLPEWASETTLPAQNYLRFDVPDYGAQNLFDMWQKIEQDTAIQRSFTTDFETHTYQNPPRIYIGVLP